MKAKLTGLAIVFLMAAAALSGPCSAAPPVIELCTPETVMVGEPVNISVNVSGNPSHVFIHFKVNNGTLRNYPLVYDPISGSWNASINFYEINYSAEITWVDVQVDSEQIVLDGYSTQVLKEEESSNSWELVLVVIFLGTTMVIIQLLFRPMRRPRKDVDEEDGDEKEDKKPDEEN